MTARKRVVAIVSAVIVAIGVVFIVLNIAGIREAFRAPYRDDTEIVLSRQITGYFPSEWEDASSMTVRTVDSFGAYVNEFRWSGIGSQYRHYQDRPGLTPPDWSYPLSVDARGEMALQNALNIAVRDQLWTQKDVSNTAPVCDGGSATYEFSLGPHRGQFTLTNVSFPEAPHLKAFILNAARWTSAVRSQVEAAERDAATTKALDYLVRSNIDTSRHDMTRPASIARIETDDQAGWCVKWALGNAAQTDGGEILVTVWDSGKAELAYGE